MNLRQVDAGQSMVKRANLEARFVLLDPGRPDRRRPARYAENTLEALVSRQALGLPDVYKDYASLEGIATARQDEAQAAVWRAKKEAKIAELEKLAGPQRLPPAFLEAVTALCQAIHFARSAGAPLPLPVTEAIAALSSAAEPIGAAGRFLHAVAQAETPLPGLPGDLPAELRDLLQQLAAALPPST